MLKTFRSKVETMETVDSYMSLRCSRTYIYVDDSCVNYEIGMLNAPKKVEVINSKNTLHTQLYSLIGFEYIRRMLIGMWNGVIHYRKAIFTHIHHTLLQIYIEISTDVQLHLEANATLLIMLMKLLRNEN